MIRVLIISLLVNFWAANAQPADHRQWTDVLQEYVLENGAVDYKGLQNNKSGLESYLKLLSANAPNDEWSIDAKKAYWFTYDTILDDWTKTYIGSDPKEASTLFNSAARSKYNSGYTFAAEAPHYDIPHYQATTTQDLSLIHI